MTHTPEAMKALASQLRQMPSSLNDACRTMEVAADLLDRLASQAEPVERTELDLRLSNERAVIPENYRAPIDKRSTAEMMADRDATPQPVAAMRKGELLPYGIIDPDYARVFTVARCTAWAEGYALLFHGSFTRDLDLLAVPWTEAASEPEHLIKLIALRLADMNILVKDPEATSQSSKKPHGRLAWTFVFKTFGDPRFVDFSVMPRAQLTTQDGAKG